MIRLRFLDRYRSRGNTISAILSCSAKVENIGGCSAEAMTVFAVMTAGFSADSHRPSIGLLALSVSEPTRPDGELVRRCCGMFAVSTYATVSMVFWYVGLVPISRPQETVRKLHCAVKLMSVVWVERNDRHWSHYEMGTILRASRRSFFRFTRSYPDFAVSSLPAGTRRSPAILRRGRDLLRIRHGRDLAHAVRIGFPKFKDYITIDHMEAMNKIIMATGMMVATPMPEFFIAWYSGVTYENTPLSTVPSALTGGRTGSW